jgi:colanic acid/amylovoran biosynthesis protein
MQNNPQNKTIGIMGSPVSSGNRGVLALGSSLASLCLDHAGATEIVFFLGNRDNEPFPIRHHGRNIPVRVVNFRLSPKSKLNRHLFWIVFASLLYRCLPFLRRWIASVTPWIKAVEETLFVGDVRGGDSFSDIYGMKRFLISFLPVWSIILIKGRIVQFPQTYGPYKSALARRIAAYILKRSSTIVARDTKSRTVAESLKAPKQKIELSPDVAFSLTPIRPDSIETVPGNAGMPDKSCVGINVNGLMYNGGYTRANMFGLKMDYASFLVQLVNRFLEEQEGDIWLIPHTYAPKGDVESDNECCLFLRNKIEEGQRHRVRVLTSELDQYEVKGLIGMCGFFIGSRMHACIAALSQSVPCVGVAYSMKFLGVFESVGAGKYVVDAREYDNDAAVRACLACYRERDLIRPVLTEKVDHAKSNLARIFSSIGKANLQSVISH